LQAKADTLSQCLRGSRHYLQEPALVVAAGAGSFVPDDYAVPLAVERERFVISSLSKKPLTLPYVTT
jgi:hypothetical protein